MKHHLFLFLFLLFPLHADQAIEIQKLPSGEIQMKKSAENVVSNRSSDLKIEVVDLSLSSESQPKIEVNPPSPPSGSSKQSLLPPSSSTKTTPSAPIQIRVHEGKAFVTWNGKEQMIMLDSQGRFNLQLPTDSK